MFFFLHRWIDGRQKGGAFSWCVNKVERKYLHSVQPTNKRGAFLLFFAVLWPINKGPNWMFGDWSPESWKELANSWSGDPIKDGHTHRTSCSPLFHGRRNVLTARKGLNNGHKSWSKTIHNTHNCPVLRTQYDFWGLKCKMWTSLEVHFALIFMPHLKSQEKYHDILFKCNLMLFLYSCGLFRFLARCFHPLLAKKLKHINRETAELKISNFVWASLVYARPNRPKTKEGQVQMEGASW